MALALLCACTPLRDPTGSQCPRSCDRTCNGQCLPSGFCAGSTVTAGALGLAPLPAAGSWQLAFSGFPPGADIAFSVHGGFDIAAREGRSPAMVHIGVDINGGAAFVFLDTYASFPLWGDYQGAARADGQGVLRLQLDMVTCYVNVDSTCSIDPASTFTATLADTAQWLQAPPCD